jgi:actin, other eukaryote
MAAVTTTENDKSEAKGKTKIIILACGASNTHCGIMGEDDVEKQCTFKSCVSHVKEGDYKKKYENIECIVGVDKKKDIHFNVTFPFYTDRFVGETFWEDQERIFRHAFYNELRINPNDCAIMMPLPPLSPKMSIERLATTLFQEFCVAGVYFTDTSVATVIGCTSGTTGLAVQSGGGFTTITPVYDGYSVTHAHVTFPYAGKDIDSFLLTLLREERGQNFVKAIEDSITKEKEMKAYVALDYETDVTKTESLKPYFQCCEIMFQPNIQNTQYKYDGSIKADTTNNSGYAKDGIQHKIMQSINKVHADIRQEMFNGIALDGGNTDIKGFKERLEKELESLAVTSELSIDNMKVRKFSKGAVFEGISFLAVLDNFQNTANRQVWLLKNAYDEQGGKVAVSRFFP